MMPESTFLGSGFFNSREVVAVETRFLSIPEWHQMALTGTMLPVRIMIGGSSMEPVIRCNKDYVNIIPASDNFSVGDIVLISDPRKERYFVHRVWDIKNDQVLTWGDNCIGPDGWIPSEYVWGKVVLIERNGRKIIPDASKGVHWAKLWHHAVGPYHIYKRSKRGITRRLA